jgi:hypothetical protein
MNSRPFKPLVLGLGPRIVSIFAGQLTVIESFGVAYFFKTLPQLWGLLWGPLIHFEEFRHISRQLPTSTEFTEPERVAGLSAFRSVS